MILTEVPRERSSSTVQIDSDLSVVEQAVEQLERAFGQPFFLLDTSSDIAYRAGPDCLSFDVHSRLPLCDQVARRARPEVIEDFAPLLSLAVPLLSGEETTSLVAVTTLVTAAITNEESITAAAHALGADPTQAFRWAQGREVWNPRAATQLAQALTANAAYRAKAFAQKQQLEDVSSHLLSTFEELSVLHRLTERISIASSESELSELAIQWLADVIPADCFATVRFTNPAADYGEPSGAAQAEALTFGRCPIDEQEFGPFIDSLGPDADRRCLVRNREFTDSPAWRYPAVRELISVPIRSGSSLLGWVLVFNHSRGGQRDQDFGSVEASLVSSVASILGVHAGNCRLWGEQKEFFAAMVKALSSAIDAKDPYTSGHSDRVARLAVCLARELGSDPDELSTIYLGGLLHDIGKIGIDDQVLRKSGKLTAEEYEHIKTHPALGHQILRGVRPLGPVLPIVLHHHEAWNGKGYPNGLKGEECPRMARIVAVADAIDAMSSDRPYRPGMEDEQLDKILREGAGEQWDAMVIEAVFRVRDQIREIGCCDRSPQALDVREWHT